MNRTLIANSGPTIGMWMYQNSGGEDIQNQIINKLAKRGISVITGLDLPHASAKNGEIVITTKQFIIRVNHLPLLVLFRHMHMRVYFAAIHPHLC